MSGPERKRPARLRRRAAAALAYDPARHGAPRLLARGEGQMAERILQMARRHDVPIEDNAPLAETLVRLEPGTEIPPELFRAVAEVIAFLYRVADGGEVERR